MIHDTQFAPARLALEDGSVFSGRGFGALVDQAGRPLTVSGEVVFNTAMTGYQEALTDPSYAGQILTMTAPLVGIYGVNTQDMESPRVQAAALVIRELSRTVSNYRATTSLSQWLRDNGVPGIEGVDTRALTRRLRTLGALRGVLSMDASLSDADLVERARNAPKMAGQNLACAVSPRQADSWSEGLGEWTTFTAGSGHGEGLHVVALDCGAKRNILRNLTQRGCRVTIVPWDVTPESITALKPDGLFVSNGPGDPETVEQTINTLRALAGEIPTFGICLGHQLLCLALGARTYKLKFGHRGANQPVKNLLTGRVEITSQNHGFAVDADSAAAVGLEATHIHLNDRTLAGFRHAARPIFAVQYHPEASPGPHDSGYLFDCFIEMMRSKTAISAEQMKAAMAQATHAAV